MRFMSTLTAPFLMLPMKAWSVQFSDFDSSAFQGASGISSAALLILITVVAITILLVWAAWAIFAISLNTIATGNYGTWLFMIAAIVFILTLAYIFLF